VVVVVVVGKAGRKEDGRTSPAKNLFIWDKERKGCVGLV
jgi:hypothetical protein